MAVVELNQLHATWNHFTAAIWSKGENSPLFLISLKNITVIVLFAGSGCPLGALFFSDVLFCSVSGELQHLQRRTSGKENSQVQVLMDRTLFLE